MKAEVCCFEYSYCQEHSFFYLLFVHFYCEKKNGF